MSDWYIYHGGDRVTPEEVRDRWCAEVPPWRRCAPQEVQRAAPPAMAGGARDRGARYRSSSEEELLRANVALMLRRPLLVNGDPGLGKTTLAYNIAWCLGLGAPLRWEVNSQTTLRDGLYQYDAVGHLQRARRRAQGSIGEFITLGPLGTALLPAALPRVLLIDELDKASYDLPNDLLHVLEEASFTIPELIRAEDDAAVIPYDPRTRDERVRVRGGTVAATHHPVIVITSNDERPFPPAFLRRCVQLTIRRPSPAVLADIVRVQLEGQVGADRVSATLSRLGEEATDVLLQTLYLETRYSADPQSIDGALKRATRR